MKYEKTIAVGLLAILGLAWTYAANAMTNNEAIKVCWEQHSPSYSKAAGCAHKIIAENTRRDEQKIKDFLKNNPKYKIGKSNQVRIY